MCWVVLALWSLAYLLLKAMAGPYGELAFAMLYPALSAGFIVGCRAIERGDELELAHILAGFRSHFPQLLTLGIISLIAGFLLGWLAAILLPPDPEVIKLLENPTPELRDELPKLLPFAIGQFIASLPVLMANWFAVPLIGLDGMRATHAIRWSVYACIANLGAFTIYGLAAFVLTLLALLPLGLGLILLVPTMAATTYTSYRDVFVADSP